MYRSTSSARLWRIVGLTALAATLLLLGGFVYALQDMLNPRLPAPAEATKPSPEASQPGLAEAAEVNVVAIGDSLTKGTGDATGEGYVRQVVNGLSDLWDKPVKLMNNLAVAGMRTDQLLEKLKRDSGYRYAIRQANLILLTIGGNDLFQHAQSGAGEEGDVIDPQRLERMLPGALKRFEEVLSLLNRLNPNATVVYVGLYNPFYDLMEMRDGSLQVQQWNERAYALIHRYPQMQMIPTFDLFESRIGDYLSPDHFHPNHDGYAQIAARIMQSLK